MERSVLEKEFTSTSTKLLHNLDRLKEIQDGNLRPISIQLAPTDMCNLDCVFCSVKKRPMKELTKEECFKAVRDFVDLGAKTIEITGGGDPTMCYYINELILYCKDLGLKVGLITNGVLLNKKVRFEVLKCLTWLRVSLNCLDYVKDIELKVPDGVTLGFSYVWNEKSNLAVLEKIKRYKEKYKARYVRVVPDCRRVKFIKEYRKKIRPLIRDFPDFFFQEKDYTPPKRCWMGYLKPFVNSDGYVYHCSANPLINLKFNEKFRMGHISEIKNIWKNPKPFCTKYCGECFFKEHNELLEMVMLEVDHRDFI